MTSTVFLVTVAGALAACVANPPAGTVVATGGVAPSHLVVDSTYLYWTDGLAESGAVYKVPLGAESAAPSHVVDTTYTPASLAVDATYAYWIYEGETASTSAIVKAPLTGGGDSITLATGVGAPDELGVDATRVYWTDYESVSAVPLAGGSVQQLVMDPFAQRLVVRGTRAYWSTGHAVHSVDLADPAATPTSVDTSYLLTYGADGANVYWVTTNEDGPMFQSITLLAAPLAGGPARKLVTETANTNFLLPLIQVDDSGVYWSDGSVIRRVGIDGSGPRDVAGASTIYSFVLGASDIYFSTDAGTGTGEIRKVPKT